VIETGLKTDGMAIDAAAARDGFTPGTYRYQRHSRLSRPKTTVCG